MNRRFIAPFLAVDMTGRIAGGGYSTGSHAHSGDAGGAGNGTFVDFANAIGPATDTQIGGGGGAVTGPEPANVGRSPNPSA